MSGSGVDACTALKAADIAYQKLMTGGSIRVVVDQNGERVEYSTANMTGLLRYMQILQPQCDTYTAVALGLPLSRPTKFFF